MGRPKGRPKMLGEGSEPVRGVTLTAGQVEAIRRLQAAELAAAGVEPPRAEVIRRALDAGLPVLERGDAPGAAATTAPAPPEGPTLADVLAEVRALVRKLEGRAVAPAPASAPRTPEHDPAQLDIEHHAAELAGAKPEPEPEERRQVDDSLGVALAAWMTEHDVGSTVAARLMGVSQGMVSHWYLGNRRISPKNRAKVEALIAAPPPAEG
jgi:cell pole-organizing protein PopZ